MIKFDYSKKKGEQKMEKKAILLTTLFAGILSFTSCDSNSDEANINITIPAEVDSECCNEEETFLAYTFLNNGYLKEIESLRDTIDGKYALKAYARNGKLHVGYNDVFFALTKISTGGYVRDFSVTEVTPLMTMVKMGMQHSTPAATEADVYDANFPAVRRAWISFLMSSGESGYWDLTYKFGKQQSSKVHGATRITVDALADGKAWLKSFKVGNDTYFLSLVNPNEYQVGVNTIKAYISKKSSDIKQPYALSTEQFTVEIYPTMPDMGNHTSHNNEPLTLQADGSYEGKLNLSMTGVWDIHLNVKDAEGNTVAGGEGLSELYWTIGI